MSEEKNALVMEWTRWATSVALRVKRHAHNKLKVSGVTVSGPGQARLVMVHFADADNGIFYSVPSTLEDVGDGDLKDGILMVLEVAGLSILDGA